MKNFRITEQVKLRMQADFFNVFNVPGNEFSASGEGLVMTNDNVNSPRTLQLSGRLNWQRIHTRHASRPLFCGKM